MEIIALCGMALCYGDNRVGWYRYNRSAFARFSLKACRHTRDSSSISSPRLALAAWHIASRSTLPTSDDTNDTDTPLSTRSHTPLLRVQLLQYVRSLIDILARPRHPEMSSFVNQDLLAHIIVSQARGPAS